MENVADDSLHVSMFISNHTWPDYNMYFACLHSFLGSEIEILQRHSDTKYCKHVGHSFAQKGSSVLNE